MPLIDVNSIAHTIETPARDDDATYHATTIPSARVAAPDASINHVSCLLVISAAVRAHQVQYRRSWTRICNSPIMRMNLTSRTSTTMQAGHAQQPQEHGSVHQIAKCRAAETRLTWGTCNQHRCSIRNHALNIWTECRMQRHHGHGKTSSSTSQDLHVPLYAVMALCPFGRLAHAAGLGECMNISLMLLK